MTHDAPIGIFDSGIGGLSIFNEIHARLPQEDIIYLADSAFLPYGDKSPDQVRQRTKLVAQWLIDQHCKALVVACNTATSAAINELRQQFDLPIIGVEPAVKPAVAQSKTGVVGVLATSGTLKGEKFALLKNQHIGQADILVQPCPGLVELIEAGEFDSPVLRRLITDFLTPLLEQGADTLVLGCTHYPLIKSLIAELAGPDITVLDPGRAVARELERRLRENDELSTRITLGALQFFTTADSPNMRALAASRWQAPLKMVNLDAMSTFRD